MAPHNLTTPVRPWAPVLDDPERLRQGDPLGMVGILSSLPEQLEEGLRRAREVVARLPRPERVTVVGMGGSAIVGDLAAALADRYGGPEVRVRRTPDGPRDLGRRDLLVAVSYSGDTWETLRAYQQGLRTPAGALTVGSGGQLRAVSDAKGVPHAGVPEGLPPRAALGYLLAPLLALLARDVPPLAEALPGALEGLARARQGWAPVVPTAENLAKGLAIRLRDRTPIVYAPLPLVGVARRWQTQLNENAKVLAWHGGLPEGAHNEVVGWLEDPRAEGFAALLLEAPGEGVWNAFLPGFRELLAERLDVVAVRPRATAFLPALLELVLLGDLTSAYLALLRGVDPWPVTAIGRLKAKLADRGLGGTPGRGSAEGEI